MKSAKEATGSRGPQTPGGDPASVCLSPREAHQSRSSDVRPGCPGSQFQGPLHRAPAGGARAAGMARAFQSLSTGSRDVGSYKPGQRCCCVFDDRN